MHEVISEVEPSSSSKIYGAFIVLSLILAAASIGFAVGVFLPLATMYLGVLLAVAFASMGGMILAYHRLFHPHRIVLEYDDDLW